MKKILLVLITMMVVSTFTACNNESKTTTGTSVNDVLEQQTGQSQTTGAIDSKKIDLSKPDDKYDVDLASMNSTMMYSQFNDMMINPDNYIGKKVRMKGIFMVNEWNGNRYFSVFVEDSTACCAAELEFLLPEDKKYPEDYPTPFTEITIDGYFNTYLELNPEDGMEYMYVNLINARLLEN